MAAIAGHFLPIPPLRRGSSNGSPAVDLFPKATEDPQNALLSRMFAGVSIGYTAGFCRLWFSYQGLTGSQSQCGSEPHVCCLYSRFTSRFVRVRSTRWDLENVRHVANNGSAILVPAVPTSGSMRGNRKQGQAKPDCGGTAKATSNIHREATVTAPVLDSTRDNAR